jgi:hypothetical protein
MGGGVPGDIFEIKIPVKRCEEIIRVVFRRSCFVKMYVLYLGTGSGPEERGNLV